MSDHLRNSTDRIFSSLSPNLISIWRSNWLCYTFNTVHRDDMCTKDSWPQMWQLFQEAKRNSLICVQLAEKSLKSTKCSPKTIVRIRFVLCVARSLYLHTHTYLWKWCETRYNDVQTMVANGGGSVVMRYSCLPNYRLSAMVRWSNEFVLICRLFMRILIFISNIINA